MTDTLMTQSAIVVSEVDVLIDGILVDTITQVLPGGYVTLDTTAENVRTCSFSCLDPNGTLMPFSNNGSSGGTLMPDGVEVSIHIGYLIDDEPMLWPQGVFGVQEAIVSTSSGDTDSGGGTFPGPGPNISITGVDRSDRVAKNTFEDTFTIAGNTPVGEAIREVLTQQAPWCTQINIEPSDFMVAQQVFAPGDDPWQMIVALAAAAGMVAYFDAMGVFVCRSTPSLAGTAVSIGIADGPDNIAISCTPIYSNNPGYNGVTVINTSASSTDPITGAQIPSVQLSGSAFDMNPASRTYALGSYGKRPAPPVTVTTATSNAMCAAMAQSLLPQVLGMSNSVVVDNLPVPQLDAYALIYLSNAVVNIVGTFILQQATIYLDYTTAESMTMVPLGSPISALVYLKGPSQAAFGSANPNYVGAGLVSGSAFTYSYSPYGTSSGFGGRGGLGGFGNGSSLNNFGFLFRGSRISRITRPGRGDSDYEKVVEDVEDI